MRIFFLSILLVVGFFAGAQTVTGSWYGIADAAKPGTYNNYLTELIIKQKGDDVEGVFGYYFRDGYQSYYVRGKYNAKTRQLIIPNIPITYFRSLNIDGIDCPMDLTVTLMVSRVQSTLKGAFISQEKYKYTCPELRVAYNLDESEKNQDSLIRSNTDIVKKYWKPRQEELVVNTGNIMPAPMPTLPALVTQQDTARQALVVTETQKAETRKLVESFEHRKNIMMEEIEIESDSVRISFYDNGDIDGDSITVFINKLPVLTHQPLSDKALNIYLAFNKGHDTTDVGMYAENLGKYPPNTALMVIADGEKRHEVFLSSSLTQNAVVRLKRKRK
jgi:hypothetical protein